MLPINDYYFPLQTGGSSKEEQEKSITITSNGVNTVTPDAGKSLSKVSITTNVPQSVEAYKTADKWTSLAAYIEADPNE